MAASVEVLISGDESLQGKAAMECAAVGADLAGLEVVVTKQYRGKSDWLCLYGPGHAHRNLSRMAHVASGRQVACWDIGYISRKVYARVAVDHNHPQRLFNETPNDGSRWDVHGITLRDDYDPNGHIVVAGMGPKSRAHLGLYDWELKTLFEVQARFPKKRVLYRPKPQGSRDPQIAWTSDGTSSIEDVLRGASLAVCRHSNVAVDACIAGIPVECEDGAARWLYAKGSNPDAESRLDFLHRLAYWQWKNNEMREAWTFLQAVSN